MIGFTASSRCTLLLASTLLAYFPIAAQTSPAAALPVPQIRLAVDESSVTALHDGLNPKIFLSNDKGEAPSDLQLSKMVLLLKRSPEVQAALNQFTIDQQDPHSPSYHQWLTPAQMGQRFGVASEDLNQVSSWLQGNGFQIDSIAHSGLLIVFSGTHAQLQHTFHTSMHVFTDSSGANHYANVKEPSVPSALLPVVAGIASLNNFPLKAMHHISGAAHRDGSTADWSVRPVASKSLPAKGTNAVNPEFAATIGTSKFQVVGPYDFATMYNILPLWAAGIDGTGQTVAVLAVSDINPKDVDSFRTTFGLPAKPVNMIYVGPNPGIVSGGEEEADLDAQWSGAVAKNANIDVVVAGDTAATSGLILGAYHVVDNNLASILSVSFGDCELGLGNSGNQLYNSIWQQAAAEGITVAIAAGDAGSAGCDQGAGTPASYGLTVNGLASSPYDVAVGGTDLYGTFTSQSTYWSATNNSITLQSALNYVPEIPWNDSCGNPQYLAALHARGTALADTTSEAFCNDTNLSSTINEVAGGGGGGLSNCVDSVYNNVYSYNCYSGYPKPYWQTGVVGIPTVNQRSVPDISLFAGDGLWNSAYVLCSSDNTPDGLCNYQSSTDLEYLAAGGTSFGTPAFAGIMALVNQKLGTRQGNAAPALYRLAAQQFGTTVQANCDASVATAGSSCFFQDISTGTIAQPCQGGARDCHPNGSHNIYGVLPGFSATPGFDSAVGLGSLNVANLTNAWTKLGTTFTASKTSLSFAQTTFAYGAAASGSASVTAAIGAGIPTGDVSTLSGGYGNGPFTLLNGQIAVSVLGLSPGSHVVTAHYEGDNTFGASDSTGVNISITAAPTSLTVKPSKTALFGTDTVTLSTTLATTSNATSPTGAVVFTDTTTGTTLGSAALQSSVDTSGHSIAAGGLIISGHLLALGSNTISATYTGDLNYSSAIAPSVAISYTSPFRLTASQSSLTLHPNGSGSINVTVTATSGTLSQDVFLACPQALPAGLSCVFSPAILPAGSSSTTSTFTLYASSAIGSALPPAMPNVRSDRRSWMVTSLAGLLLILLPAKRRRGVALLPIMFVAMWTALLSGCSGSSSAAKATRITLTSSAATAQLGSPVTFTGIVTDSSGAPVVSGPVVFYENGVTQSSSNLNNSGVATFTTSALSTGNHTLTATFGPSATDSSSTSAPVSTDITFSTGIQLTATDSSANTSSIMLPVVVQ